MANVKFDGLPQADALTDANIVAVQQSTDPGGLKKAQLSMFKQYLQSLTGQQQISLLNILTMQDFGDSIPAGYLCSTIYKAFTERFSIMGNIGLSQRAVSNTGVFLAASLGYQFIAPLNTTSLSMWMAGLNDIRYNGATQACLNQIQGCTTAFLVNHFARYMASAGGTTNTGSITSIVKTGTWSTIDASSYGSKSQYLSPSSAAQSSVSGSSITFNIDANAEILAIGTFSDDGTVPNALGAFSVYVDGVLRTTYNPHARNTGIANPSGALQGRMPEAILIRGVAATTIAITTNSNTLTVIDYLCAINLPQNCAPAMICQIPHLTATGYAAGPAVGLSDAVLDQGSAVLQTVVESFSDWGLPAYFIPIVKYIPIDNVTTQPDGIHPNDRGHGDIFEDVAGYIQGNTGLYLGNDIVVNQIPIGQGAGSSGISGANLQGFRAGRNALIANVSGSDMICIGGGAGQRIQSNQGNVLIGTNAGNSIVIHGFNTFVGDNTGSTQTANYCTLLGRVAPSIANTDKSVVMGDGAGNIRFEYRDDKKSISMPSDGGTLLSKITTTQRDAISGVVEGTEIYNTTLHKKQVYTGSVWETITSV